MLSSIPTHRYHASMRYPAQLTSALRPLHLFALVALVFVLAAACDGGGPMVIDAGYDAGGRTCDEAITYTTVNDPPCSWDWTCSDYSGSAPQYSITCVAGSGSDVDCECREAGVLLGTIAVADGCFTIADACEAANAGCGFSEPITCD